MLRTSEAAQGDGMAGRIHNAILFWSERGEVACGKHAPYRGSDTWEWERWQAVTPIDRREAYKMGERLRCETCGSK